MIRLEWKLVHWKVDIKASFLYTYVKTGKQDGRPSLWLAEAFSTSSLKPLNGIQQNLTGKKISMSSTNFVFFGPIGKKDGRPGLWLAETFSTSSLKFFIYIRKDGKARWPPQPLIGWGIFDFFSKTAERNSTKLDRKQDLNVFYQVFVFWADRKNKMAAPAPDWLRHFRLLNWNRWTEFDETRQEARSQRPLISLCFSGRSVKKRLPPWPMIVCDIFDFSSKTADPPWGRRGFKPRIRPPYPQRVVKGD